MDVMPIFSSEQDAAQFEQMWRQKQGGSIEIPWVKVVVEKMPKGADPKSWKKLYGVAHVLEEFGSSGYEFALMMDAEIGINSCDGFASMPGRLRAKHDAKVWFGDRTKNPGDPDMQSHIKWAACCLAPHVGSNLIRADKGELPCGDPAVMSKIEAATDHFQVYTWWNEVPYVHLATARRMFNSWAALLGNQNFFAAVPNGALFPKDMLAHYVRAHHVSNEADPSPVQVSEHMGEQGASDTLQRAGGAFEHLIYQMYTVAFEGFQIRDVTGSYHNHLGCSLNERFWELDDSDKRIFLSQVQPMWLPGNTTGWSSPGGPILLQFHLDRHEWWTPAPKFTFQWQT